MTILDANFQRPDGSTDESVKHSWDTEPMQVWVDVDRGIAPLVRVLNRMPSIRTWASCEGYRESKRDTRGYVGIEPSPVPPSDLTRDDRWAAITARLRTILAAHPEIRCAIEDAGKAFGRLYVDPDQVGALANVLEVLI